MNGYSWGSVYRKIKCVFNYIAKPNELLKKVALPYLGKDLVQIYTKTSLNFALVGIVGVERVVRM